MDPARSRKRGYYDPSRTPLEHPLANRAGYRVVNQEPAEEGDCGEENGLERASDPRYDGCAGAVPVRASCDCCKFCGVSNRQRSDLKPRPSGLPVEGVWDQSHGQSRVNSINVYPASEPLNPSVETTQHAVPLQDPDEDGVRARFHAEIARDNATDSLSVSRPPISANADSAHSPEGVWAPGSSDSPPERPIRRGSAAERPIRSSGSEAIVYSSHVPKGPPSREDCVRSKQQHRPNRRLPARSTSNNPWGNCSYADLLTMAILSSEDKRLTLSEIYDWISENIPYFKGKRDVSSLSGWKNSIRHILSVKKRFIRLARSSVDGRSQEFRGWWSIDPNACVRERANEPERLCACQPAAPHHGNDEEEVETDSDC